MPGAPLIETLPQDRLDACIRYGVKLFSPMGDRQRHDVVIEPHAASQHSGGQHD